MPRLKFFKNSTPEIEDRLNKYKDMYSEYIKLLVEVHNLHVQWLSFPNRSNTWDYKMAVAKVKKMSNTMYLDIQDIQRLVNARQKERYAEGKAKRQAMLARRAANKARKLNDMAASGDNSNGTT
jgi:hypothetical protein